MMLKPSLTKDLGKIFQNRLWDLSVCASIWTQGKLTQGGPLTLILNILVCCHLSFVGCGAGFHSHPSQACERLPFFDSSELVEPNMLSVVHALMVATQALSVSLESGGCTTSKY